jgi:hypothetical protein
MAKCTRAARLFGYTVKDDMLCLVMKRYPQNLAQFITTFPGGRVPATQAVHKGVLLFTALAELHAAGIIARV